MHPVQQLTTALALALSIMPGASVAKDNETAIVDIEHLREEHRWLDALAAIGRARAEAPESPALYRLQVLTLLDLGSSHQAWTLYRARPELFDRAEAERLEGAQLARLVTWGGLYAESEQARTQKLALAEQALQDRRASSGGPDLRARYDEIVLLNRLERHDEVVAHYRALQAERVELPPYALARVAESLLAERHPAEAIPLFQQVERELPEDWDARLLLGYAYSESEDFDAAYAHLEALKTAEPAWLRVPGARQDHANPRHYDADSNLALLHLYGQDSAGAQQRLEALAVIGPNNAGLQTALGEVYRARGWSERALERFRIAGTLEPEHVGAAIGQIGALLDLDRVDLARPLHDRLLAEHPRNLQVRQMARDWDNRMGWQWQLEATSGRSDGDAADGGTSPLGNRDGSYRVAVQSPLLNDRWRATAETRDAWADFQGARVHDHRSGVGLSYAYDRLTASAGVDRAHDDWTDQGTGGYLNAGWRLSDTWHIGAGWRRNTPEGSLQARRSGITADSLSLSASWVPRITDAWMPACNSSATTTATGARRCLLTPSVAL
ncbi:tetratricopeptide repeat protein [Marilutibacter alkalisoli]|nr:tetratricopeptide repeat protein [Lysobacter alkalisoli]